MSFIDWIIVAFFLGTLVTIGYRFSHRNRNIDDYFVAGRAMPGWLVTIAATGTSISAGTFVGSPELGFNTNLTYVLNLAGAIIGGCIVAALILPKLYRSQTITIYGFIGRRFGRKAKEANSLMFLVGQLFTSGSRLFIAAIAVSVILFGSIHFRFLIFSIIILGVISTIYTMMGGIKGLLYIDAFQTLLFIFTGLVALALIYRAIDLPLSDIWHTLTDGGMVRTSGAFATLNADATLTGWESGNKLRIFDPSFRFDLPYTMIGGLLGVAFFKIAQYTTDHEFVQRQLACKDLSKASSSLIMSQVLSLPVVLIFLSIGLLFYAMYRHDPTSAAFIDRDGTMSSFFTDARDIFPQYIKNHIPTGLRGLMIVGLLAAALSSFNSAINAMASSFVSDLYLPFCARRGRSISNASDQLVSSRRVVFGMGMLLTGFAIVTAVMQQSCGLNLVDFAMGIMCFAYTGMIGVFLTAIFSRRGNTRSVIAALVAGALITLPLMFQKELFGTVSIAWTWWCPIGGLCSTLICLSGSPESAKQLSENEATQ
ncbi:sodium:solute symporter family transporter [Alistipes shahii]|uniref:sodium:solute symporter family transporter n=1 Tax=Alistipes shahii TaxID=328814 RepID=UPI003FD7EB49